MDKINQIKELQTYKEILNDSFGGVLYDVANKNKYNTIKLLELWNELTPSEKESAGGIMKGVFNFIK